MQEANFSCRNAERFQGWPANKPQPSDLTSSPITTKNDPDKKIASVEDGITSLPEVRDSDISAFKRVTYWQQTGTKLWAY